MRSTNVLPRARARTHAHADICPESTLSIPDIGDALDEIAEQTLEERIASAWHDETHVR